LLPVNRNTFTAPLPPDYDGFLFGGIINEQGYKVPIKTRSDIVIADAIEVDMGELCAKCSQRKAICEDLYVSQEENIIMINNVPYTETIIKKLLPNGDYYEERNTPTLNLDTGLITYESSQDFITNFELQECGCLSTDQENLDKLNEFCPDIYSTYFAPMDKSGCAVDFGAFRIMEEVGLIAFDQSFPFDWFYLEYNGFLPKANGIYLVPEVAFETLVNLTKFLSVQNKKSVPLSERNWYFQNYTRERGNMNKRLRRISLSQIIHSIGLTPRFAFNVDGGWYSCYNSYTMNCRKTKTSKLSQSCGVPQPQLIQTIYKTEQITNEIVHRHFKFEVGDAVIVDAESGAIINFAQPLGDTETQMTFLEEGVKEGSVAVIVNNVPLNPNEAGELSYSIVYGLNGFTITMSEGANLGDKYQIKYTKVENV
jgi:hypothetical protein